MINKELLNTYKRTVKNGRYPYMCFIDGKYYATDGHILLIQKTNDKPPFEMFNPITGQEEDYTKPAFEHIEDITFFEEVKNPKFTVWKRSADGRDLCKNLISVEFDNHFLSFNLDLFKQLTFSGTDGKFYYRSERDGFHFKTDKGQGVIMPIRNDAESVAEKYTKIKQIEFKDLHKKVDTCFLIRGNNKFKIFKHEKDARDFIKTFPGFTIKEIILN